MSIFSAAVTLQIPLVVRSGRAPVRASLLTKKDFVAEVFFDIDENGEKLNLLRDLLFRLHDQFDGRSHLVFDGDICELRHTTHVDTIVPQIPCRQDERLDSLVDCSRADGLHFGPVVLTNDACDGARDGGCA